MVEARPRWLVITAQAHDAMIAHCVKGAASARCGILAGVPPTASVAYPLRNAAKNPLRYEADVRDLFRATMDLRKRKLDVVAIYYSRPKMAAVPTPTDLRENAHGDVPRVIVALSDPPAIRVWRLTRRYCEELTWRLEPSDAGPTPGAAGSDENRPEPARGVAEDASPRFPWSVVSWLWGRRRAGVRIPIRRLRDDPPLEPEPMWDAALDRPREDGRPRE